MSKSLITFIAIVFLAGAVVDADNIYNRIECIIRGIKSDLDSQGF